MNEKQFDKQKIIDHWFTGSDEDYDTMIALHETHQYSWSLFLGHLMIEKLLKAYFVKIKEDYPAFTLVWVNKMKKLRLWIKEQIK